MFSAEVHSVQHLRTISLYPVVQLHGLLRAHMVQQLDNYSGHQTRSVGQLVEGDIVWH